MSIKQVYRNYIKYLDSVSQRLRIKKQYIGEWIDVLWGKDAKIIRETKLTKEEVRQIQIFWKKEYGKKIPLYWHKRYKAYSGVLDVKYFPEVFYTTKLEPSSQSDKLVRTLNNKALIEILFARVIDRDLEIKVPKTICGCANNFFYDENRMPISKMELLMHLKSLQGEYIIKPTVGGSSGRDVELLNLKNGEDINSKKKLEDILENYNGNFIIQEKVYLNKIYAKLHPSSVNTVRVMTYRKDCQIKHAPMIIRIGCGGSHLDNAHAGGLYIAVDDNGKLGSYAINCNGEKYDKHPDTHILFKNYSVPMIDKIIEKAIVLHTCLPEISFVNWDFCVDSYNRIVLIEANMSCGSIWLYQNAHGQAVFGRDTEYMINKLKES